MRSSGAPSQAVESILTVQDRTLEHHQAQGDVPSARVILPRWVASPVFIADVSEPCSRISTLKI